MTDERQVSLGIGSDRQQALLAYLLLHRRTPQPRQRLAFHLWPDSTESQSRSNLRKALSHLRQALPEPDTVLLAYRRGPSPVGSTLCSRMVSYAAETLTHWGSAASSLRFSGRSPYRHKF